MFFPEQRRERRSDSTSKPENVVFSLVAFEDFLLFSTQHNSDGLQKTKSKSEYEGLTEVDLNPH